MALVSLFFKPTKAQLGLMELDASISESHEATAQVTSNPIENGANVNDHVILDPIKITIEGTVSETPLGVSALVGSAFTTVGSEFSKSGGLAGAAAVIGAASIGALVAGNIAAPDGGPESRDAADVYTYLLQLRDGGVPFKVITGLKQYDNMLLTSIKVPRNASIGNQLRFTATLQQARIVKGSEVELAGSLDSTLAEGAVGAADLGKQGAGAASSKTGSDASLLYQALGF